MNSNNNNNSAVPLIIDTDMGGGGCHDVDDVTAVCIAHALADNGEADLLAIVQNSSPPKCAGVISALNHYYGRDNIPIGAYRGTDMNANDSFLSYVPDIADNFPSTIKNSSQVPSSTDIYRRVLASQPDRSVVISSIGLLTNLRALLQSTADVHSPLNGTQLFALKVKRLAVMGGLYPKGGRECNLEGGKEDHEAGTAASSYVMSHMPTEVNVIFSGFEVGVFVNTGGPLQSCAPASNPCRQALLDYCTDLPHLCTAKKAHSSFDPLTTLVAVRGAAAAGCAECSNCSGSNSVDSNTGRNKWIPGPASNQTYLVLKNAKAATDTLDGLLCQPPKHGH
jgi:hypothetical protein